MSPEDIQQITAIVGASEQRIVAAAQERTLAIVAASEQRTLAMVTASKDETIEAMRDMQTEILRGIEQFARGNFARMHRIETSDNDTNVRITALEEPVLYLETRGHRRLGDPPQ